MKHQPPKWADRFLEWFCNPRLLEDLQGDLYELYMYKVEQGKPFVASFQYIWHVFRSLRYSVIRRDRKYQPFMMTKNNIKIAFRVLWRDRLNTVLNLGGLAIGITCFLLMGFYVKQELSYDQFHAKKDRIYRVWVKEVYSEDKVFFNSITPLIFEQVLEENFGEIETAVQYTTNNYQVGSGESIYSENIGIISPEFFDVFDFELIAGNTSNPLRKRDEVVLSESYAVKYFGDEDPIGRSLPIQMGEEKREFIVSAVYEDIAIESSIQFNMAISNENNTSIYSEGSLNGWFQIYTETYILLDNNANIESVEARTSDMVMAYLKGKVEPGVYNIGFQPLTDIHLNQDIPVGIAPIGNPNYVYTLGIIGLLVLITAVVNYTTLAVGQSLKRSKEVGVRKVMGALKRSLVNQYLSESILVALFAVLLGVLFAHTSLPFFNDLTGSNVSFAFEPWHILLYLVLIVIVGIASGIYPSLVLSRLRVISILKGNKRPRGNYSIRKGMVVFQFIITVFLISSTLIMQKQLNYIQEKDLGLDYNATVSVRLYPDPTSNNLIQRINTAMERGNLLKEKLKSYPSIEDIGMGSHVFGTNGWANFSYTDDKEIFRSFRLLVIDPYYLETFNIKAEEGRFFDPESGLDTRQSIILNKTAVDYFDLKDPVGKQLPGKNFGDHRIIGVTEDFNYSSLHSAIEPLVITQNPLPIMEGISDVDFDDSPMPKMVFRYTGKQLSEVREILNKEWPPIFPEMELNFSFTEENMRAQYANDNQMNKLVLVSTILAVIIASLGLLGMTVLMINSRTKEIAIRKVIGASGYSIFTLLARSFSFQLIIGIVLSIPITFWLMDQWLNEFAYRINIGIDMFLLSAVLSVTIALLVISFHTVRASLLNPVDSIKSE